MALSVTINEKGETILAGETPVECSNLVVETVALEKECESFDKIARIDECRVCFNKMNQRASVLQQQNNPGKNWSILISEPRERIGKDHYLRLIAIGHEKSYVGIYDPAGEGSLN